LYQNSLLWLNFCIFWLFYNIPALVSRNFQGRIVRDNIYSCSIMYSGYFSHEDNVWFSIFDFHFFASRLHISGPLGIMQHKIYTSPSKELYLNYRQKSNHNLNYSQKHHTLSKVAYSFLSRIWYYSGSRGKIFFQ